MTNPPATAGHAPMPDSIGSPAMRRAGRELLSLALMDARNHTLAVLAAFEAAQAAHGAPAPVEGLDPPAWTAGHVAWLAERWIARNPQRALGAASAGGGARLASIDPQADDLFDPALAPPALRWQLQLPDWAALRAYLLATLETTLDLLDTTPETDAGLHLWRLALAHEDAQGERLVMLAQALGVPLPLAPAAGGAAREPIALPATRWQLGLPAGGFALDIERPQHEVAVPAFEIDAQAVSWAQFVEFVDDGGYDRPELWQPEGWAWLEALAAAEGRRGPRHVEQIGVASGAVMQTLFGRARRMAGSQCAMHVSWWEADAWARWAGRRLPTEVEWEIAACTLGSRGFRWGEVHEWCAGTLRAWDGWQPDGTLAGTVLDAQPWLGRARTRRGASFATRSRSRDPRARAWALPGRDEAFVGFRTCSL